MSLRSLFIFSLPVVLTLSVISSALSAEKSAPAGIAVPKLPLKLSGEGCLPQMTALTGPLHDEPGGEGPLAAQDEPEIDAVWNGATVWMTGVAFSGGETFGGSIAKGIYFFGSTLTNADYVPVEIRFNGTDTTLCQTFRRDLGYASAGVGKFPGSVWDVSDTSSPRRLNICFVEDNTLGVANLLWDPNDIGSPTFGKREYLYVMLSSYDGSGTTYAGYNGGPSGADTMDILYNWWPLVSPGHTLYESLPATLTITPYHVKSARAIPDSGQLTLTWAYFDSNAVKYRIYSATASPATALLDSVNSPFKSYLHTGLTNGITHYYRIEAVGAGDTVVGRSREFSAYPQKMGYLVDLVGYWHERDTYGDIWGYTDSGTGKEYALICSRPQGVSIIDINVNPPVEVGFIPSITPNRDAKDVKIYKSYAVVIKESEAAQVVDISDVTNPVQVATISPSGGGAHNCQVVGDYLYIVGNHGIGGVEIFNMTNPSSASKVGEFQPFYYHDTDIRSDTLYACGIFGDGVDILDISDKASPSRIDLFNYASSGAHNVEISEDGKYVFVGDEIGGSGNWTRAFDVSNPASVVKVADLIVDSQAIVHNCYVEDTLLYIAHYTEGLRIWNVADPTNPFEVAHYDTYQPAIYTYAGAWSVYPYFASGKVIVSDMQTGLYVLRPDSSIVPLCSAIPGDANASGSLTLTDVIAIVNYVFNKPGCSPQPLCWLTNLLCRGDWNASNSVTLTDVIQAVNFVFNKPGGPWNPLAVGVCCQPLP